MTETATAAAVGPEAPPTIRPTGDVRSVLRFIRREPGLSLALAWIGLLAILTCFVQWLPVGNPNAAGAAVNLAPSWSGELLGTDAIGRSNLARAAHGVRVSMGISLASVTLSMVVGGSLGLLTAHVRGRVSAIVDMLATTVLAVPLLMLLLAIVLALGPSYWTITFAIALVFVPMFMRLTRANAMTQMSRDYVRAARAMGATAPDILVREVLPNTFLPILSYAALLLPGIVITEGGLSYLGFGVPPPAPSWGNMIAQAQPNMAFTPWPAIVPCAVLFVTVFAFQQLGDRLRGRFDVRDINV